MISKKDMIQGVIVGVSIKELECSLKYAIVQYQSENH